MQTHYDLLEVKETASEEVIKGAYKFLSQKWHPDKHPDNQVEAEKRTSELNAAYYVLSDSIRRTAYDVELAFKRRESANRQGAARPGGGPSSPPPPDSAPAGPEFIDVDGKRIRLRSIFRYELKTWNEVEEYYLPPKEPKGFWENFGALAEMLEARDDKEQRAFVERKRAERRRTQEVTHYEAHLHTSAGLIVVKGEESATALITELDRLPKK
ncbi:MAG: J domain-containing protein [Proteobacteria bacterium]|nr:J domain-containing protein [Pseudomonadota bacterium]